jgi:D-3-phosphoglycerate dehydrogenase
MTHNLLLTQALPEPGMRLLATRTDVRVSVLAVPTRQALAAALPGADGVIVVMEEPALTAAMIGAASRLRVACRCGAGYDNIDVAALTARGIPLVTTGAANADTVAEHALYLMLALARRGPRLDRAVRPARGRASSAPSSCATAAACRRLRQHRAARGPARPRLPHARPRRRSRPGCGHRRARRCTVVPTLHQALPDADFVVLACALTPTTRGLIDAAALARMKPSAFLVNVARGPVVDEAALVAALEAGGLAGAGLDVLQTEPPLPDNPLLTRDDVVLTPHTAAYVATAYDRMAVAAAEKTLAGLDRRLGRQDVVNPDALAPGV